MKYLLITLFVLTSVSCGTKTSAPTTADAIKQLRPEKLEPVSPKPVREASDDVSRKTKSVTDALKRVRSEAEKAEQELEQAKSLNDKFAATINHYEAVNKEVADKFKEFQEEAERLRIRSLVAVSNLKDEVRIAEDRARKAEFAADQLRKKVSTLSAEIAAKNDEADRAQKATDLGIQSAESYDDLVAEKVKLDQKVSSLMKYFYIVWGVVLYFVIKLILKAKGISIF